MKEYPVHLYPVKLQLINGDHSNARMTIALPPTLPWWELWMSVGASLYALAQAYDAAKEFLSSSEETGRSAYPWGDSFGDEYQYGTFVRDTDGRIHFRPIPPIRPPSPIIIGGALASDELRDELRIVRLSYNSPIDIEMIVGFATAFSLVGAIATGAITTTIKLLEWREKKKELEDEDRRRDLEIELKRLELEEKKAQIAQTAATTRPSETPSLPEPQMVIVQKLFFYGDILAGKEEVWMPSAYR